LEERRRGKSIVEDESEGVARDGRKEGGEGYRLGMEERREVRDTDEGWKRGGR
jgi:hypothetical protein